VSLSNVSLDYQRWSSFFTLFLSVSARKLYVSPKKVETGKERPVRLCLRHNVNFAVLFNSANLLKVNSPSQ
jgi:hypothetical protein